MAQERPQAAAEALQGAVARAPNDLIVRVAYADALWHVGSSQAAVAELTQALRIDGSAVLAIQARGEILADLGGTAGSAARPAPASSLRFGSCQSRARVGAG